MVHGTKPPSWHEAARIAPNTCECYPMGAPLGSRGQRARTNKMHRTNLQKWHHIGRSRERVASLLNTSRTKSGHHEGSGEGAPWDIMCNMVYPSADMPGSLRPTHKMEAPSRIMSRTRDHSVAERADQAARSNGVLSFQGRLKMSRMSGFEPPSVARGLRISATTRSTSLIIPAPRHIAALASSSLVLYLMVLRCIVLFSMVMSAPSCLVSHGSCDHRARSYKHTL